MNNVKFYSDGELTVELTGDLSSLGTKSPQAKLNFYKFDSEGNTIRSDIHFQEKLLTDKEILEIAKEHPPVNVYWINSEIVTCGEIQESCIDFARAIERRVNGEP